MARCAHHIPLLCLLLAAACEEPAPPARPEPARPIARPPEAPRPPEKERVSLRWKVPADRPLALQADMTLPDPKRRTLFVDLRKWGGPAARVDLPAHVTEQATLHRAGEEFELRTTLTSVTQSRMKRGTKEETREVRAEVSPSGFLSANMPEHTRRQWATALELPAQPVAVGESWESSVVPVWVEGAGWEQEGKERTNRATLTALGKDEQGRRVASIDLDNSETLTLRFSDSSPFEKRQKYTRRVVSSINRGHGEFLVDEGRWKSLQVHSEIRDEGMGHIDLAMDTTYSHPAGPAAR